jgi:hypothetical protein
MLTNKIPPVRLVAVDRNTSMRRRDRDEREKVHNGNDNQYLKPNGKIPPFSGLSCVTGVQPTSNENKMSDGGQARASLGVEVREVISEVERTAARRSLHLLDDMMGLSGAGLEPTPGNMNSVYHTGLSSLEGTRCQFNGGTEPIKIGIDVHQGFLCGGLPGGRNQSQAAAAFPQRSLRALGDQA